MIHNYAVRKALNDIDLEQIFGVRKEVFVHEQNIPVELEYDEIDHTCDHYGIWHGDECVGGGRSFLIHDGSTLKIGRLCVHKDHRGQGLATRLIQYILDQYWHHETVKDSLLDAQTSAAGLYLKLGYAPFGDEFQEAGIAHIKMKKTKE